MGPPMNFADILSLLFTITGLSSMVYVIFKIKKDHEEEFKRLYKRIERHEDRMYLMAMNRMSAKEAIEDLLKEKKEEMEKERAKNPLNVQLASAMEQMTKPPKEGKKK